MATGGTLTPSPTSVYYTPAPTPGEPPQCRLWLGPNTMSSPVSEADRDRLIQVRENNLQARQAERQHRSLRSHARQSHAMGVATARVFNTKEQPSPADSIAGRVSAASELEKKPGDV